MVTCLKAVSMYPSDGAVALAEVERIDGQIAREENKIEIIEDRILSIGGTVDVSESIQQQENIRDGAWDRVQGDIDFANRQIVSLRAELKALDDAVNELRNKGVEVVTLDERRLIRQQKQKKLIMLHRLMNYLHNKKNNVNKLEQTFKHNRII